MQTFAYIEQSALARFARCVETLEGADHRFDAAEWASFVWLASRKVGWEEMAVAACVQPELVRAWADGKASALATKEQMEAIAALVIDAVLAPA